jgi:hypothetical protein
MITGMFGFYLTMSFFFLLGFFHGSKLILGQNQSFLGSFGFQGFEPFLEGLQVVPKPNTSDTTGRDESGGEKIGPIIIKAQLI